MSFNLFNKSISHTDVYLLDIHLFAKPSNATLELLKEKRVGHKF
jgi:hypothetical protein